MNFRQNTRAMVEAALMVAVTCIFGIAGTYIPVLTFVLFLIPVPFIILGRRHGMRFMLLSIIASSFIIGMLTMPIYSIFVVVLPGITAIVMGYMMNKGYKPVQVLIGGALASIASSVLSMSLASALAGISTMDQIAEIFREVLDMQIGIYKNIGTEPEKIEGIRENLEATIQMAMTIIPAAIVLSSSFLAYINYVLTVYVLNRIGYKSKILPPIQHFRLPKSILMGTFLIIALTITTKYFKIVNYKTLMLNVIVIFNFVYFIQGLAVVSYYMMAFHIHKLLRIFVFLFLLFNRFGFFAVSILGFIDVFVNFRKLKTNI